MAGVTLKALVHNRIEHPYAPAPSRRREAFASVAETVARNTHRVLEDTSIAAPIPHLLCSTIVNTCFTAGDISWRDLRAMITDRVPESAPSFLASAYECAGWGYCVRHWLNFFSEERYCLITILDANIYNFDFWLFNDEWGDSGFGCTTVLLEKTGLNTDDLLVGSVRGDNRLLEFAFAVNRFARQAGETTIALPFFPQRVFDTLAHSLGSFETLPNGHEEWGHCFGSDPWLAIQKAQTEGEPHSSLIACSLALNGYFCMLRMNIHPDMLLAYSVAPAVDRGEDAAPDARDDGGSQTATHRHPVDEYYGVLERRPFGVRATLAQTQALSLVREHDFAAVSSFAGGGNLPVLISHAEHFALLAFLARKIRAEIPETELIVMRMRMPAQGRLPADLLDEKVLLVDGLTEEPTAADTSALNTVEVEDRFIRNPLEAGDNCIRITAARGGEGSRLSGFAPWLENFGVREIRSG